ncbi:GEL protein [Geosmithia morbida]|uniref:GEL protein n=1 Tax=Geosmithia morbida TaxID=1094350 RepID=A0A9P4YLP2_9HYPO|nr:GEL protein [Geosmithia morbida]KAF4119273.1 GEL protein [Geosmithia morbida]
MSDEVSQFLESVERLRGQQIEEDEVRTKELEDYLAAKRERQARRQERARSISPQKPSSSSSVANTPSPRSSIQAPRTGDTPRLDSPTVNHDAMASLTSGSSSPSKENVSPSDSDFKTTSSPAPLTRSSTLPWQQRRPVSRGNPRPLSLVAAQNATQRSSAVTQDPLPTTVEPEPETQPEPESAPSRDQISQSLGSEDPAFFRQTADRGQSSAAYGRDQVESQDRSDAAVGSAQLPGMSASLGERSPSISSTGTSTPQGKLAAPFPLTLSRPDATAEDTAPVDDVVKSPGRTSPTRSGSPTKGMGGFVQSAMMKRTDSVKRWSVQSPPGLARVDSVAANRSSYGRPRPKSFVRPETSRTPDTSRPASVASESRESDAGADDSTPKAAGSPGLESRSGTYDDGRSVPSSPSKTMEPRRWSPTKPTWLDSALNKPETPKSPTKPHTPTQPSWIADLNKTRAERSGTAESGHGRAGSVSGHRHQVSIGGLMRSSPMGVGVKPNTTDLGGIYSPPARGNRPEFGHASKPSLSSPIASGAPSSAMSTVQPEEKSPTKEAPTPKDPTVEAEVAAPKEKEEDMSAPAPAPEAATSPLSVPKPTPKPTPTPKPEAPPKMDFRSNLRQRPVDSGADKPAEPEFKNALGNLRRARTQSYVAPDELKDNILRGKAGLNLTGGPKKTERKDEFKEAILKKKDDFGKAQADGKGIKRTPTGSSSNDPVPEGLARRAQLGKRAGSRDETASSPGSSSVTSPSAESPELSERSLPPSNSQGAVSRPKGLGLRGPSHTISGGSALPGRVGGGKLADRFNPGLAGMLARGPPPMAVEGGKSSSDPAASTASDEPPKPGPSLTHMTKARARGPRRKAPSSTVPTSKKAPATAESSSQPAAELETIVESKPASIPTPDEVEKEPEEVGKPPGAGRDQQEVTASDEGTQPTGDTPAPISIQQQVAAVAASRGRPASASTSPERKPVSPPSPIRPQKTGGAGEASQPSSPKKLDVKRISKFLDGSSVINSSPKPEPPAKDTPPSRRTGSTSPFKAEKNLPAAPAVDVASRIDAAMANSSSPSPTPAPRPQFYSPGNAGPGPSALERNRPPTIETRPLPPAPSSDANAASPVVDTPARSPSKQTREASSLLTEFFGPARPTKSCKVDPAALLSARPQEAGETKTLSWQMAQIGSDGKKSAVQAHNAHTLFEKEMYIGAHEFTGANGKKAVHVFFWVGDDVPSSTAEDTQLFAQREARSLGGTLIKLRQGKETGEFLQAVGGPVVTRRGSSHKHDSLAPSMLCGRRHLGQVVFDEVDFSPASLCAGFAYLVAQSGRCYLWKGKGSSVDELSCARLIGMDMSLTGEMAEYDEGSEPESFWGLFPAGGVKAHSADHWRLKPNYSMYGGRLFCSEADARQQISEITPFSQADLSPFKIYILDAFFEIYVVVGSRAQSQFASFRNALNFAQEYAILAASIEDRPFVPVSTVVLEGVPRDLKRVFRKWSDEMSPTVTRPSATPSASGSASTLKRGRSLRVLPLTHALQALRD